MFVMGLSGVTCAGKTTLAHMLESHLGPSNALVVCQDKYFLPENHPNHVLCEGLRHNNWELLTALDMATMLSDVKALLKKYEFDKQKLLIVEGFLVLNHTELSSLCHLKLYIDLPYEECERRRLSRTYDPPDVPGYFQKVVWPESRKNLKLLLQSNPELHVLDGTKPVEETFRTVLELLAGFDLKPGDGS